MLSLVEEWTKSKSPMKATDGNSRNKKFFSDTLKADHKAYTETKKKKSEFVRDLVRSLRNAGSRFLAVNDNDEWVEIGDVKANEKVRKPLVRFMEEEEGAVIGGMDEVKITDYFLINIPV